MEGGCKTKTSKAAMRVTISKLVQNLISRETPPPTRGSQVKQQGSSGPQGPGVEVGRSPESWLSQRLCRPENCRNTTRFSHWSCIRLFFLIIDAFIVCSSLKSEQCRKKGNYWGPLWRTLFSVVALFLPHCVMEMGSYNCYICLKLTVLKQSFEQGIDGIKGPSFSLLNLIAWGKPGGREQEHGRAQVAVL